MTIQAVIDTILAQVPVKLAPDTMDTFKSGDPTQPVTGIVVTFLATRAVLKQAVELGANLVITHEPTYYQHSDQPTWLESDEIARTKQEWIREKGLTLWRFHDGIHQFRPDGIDVGVIRKLGWTLIPDLANGKVVIIAGQSVREIAETCKECLGIEQVRVAGDLDAVCTKVGLRLGACGGQSQIALFREHDVDVVLCGESPEWETCEYVRDAVEMGQKRALIVLGHAKSEEAGMEWFAEWLRPLIPAEVPLHYVPTGDPFRFV